MLDLGFPVDIRSEDFNETPLHAAAWYGRPNLVEQLLRAGADPSAAAGEPFGGTPLDWALRGSRHAVHGFVGGEEGTDYPAVVHTLATAGATHDPALLDEATEDAAAAFQP